MEPRSRTGRNLDSCTRGPPVIKLMGYEHREDAVGGRRSMQCQTHTQKRTHSVLRDTQGGWNLGQGSDAILTHVSVAAPLTKLMGNDHRLDTVGSGETRQVPTHTQCPP